MGFVFAESCVPCASLVVLGREGLAHALEARHPIGDGREARNRVRNADLRPVQLTDLKRTGRGREERCETCV